MISMSFPQESSRTVGDYNFGPARKGELTVFGACAPHAGILLADDEPSAPGWIGFMRGQGITRVCCLLEKDFLWREGVSLLDVYRQEFDQVLHAPISNFRTCEPALFLGKILPFLGEAERDGAKVVVHCQAGMGRTGQVLAAWLVAALARLSQHGRRPSRA